MGGLDAQEVYDPAFSSCFKLKVPELAPPLAPSGHHQALAVCSPAAPGEENVP